MGRHKNPHYSRDWARARRGSKPRPTGIDLERKRATNRKGKLKQRYGLELKDYEAMFRGQGGACAICGHIKKLHIDHCHNTGKVRGLLCQGCNHGLGNFNDDSERMATAISYLMGGT